MQLQGLKIADALEFLLSQEYFREWQSIDGCSQHPEGLNFYQWLYKKKLILKVELDEIQKTIATEKEE